MIFVVQFSVISVLVITSINTWYSSYCKFRVSTSRNLCQKCLNTWEEATASISFCIIRWWSVGLSDFGQPKIVCVLAFYQLIIIACLIITRESANMERQTRCILWKQAWQCVVTWAKNQWFLHKTNAIFLAKVAVTKIGAITVPWKLNYREKGNIELYIVTKISKLSK